MTDGGKARILGGGLVFAGLIVIGVVLWLKDGHTSPFQPPVGTDYNCTGPYPAYIGTPDGVALGCWSIPSQTAFALAYPTSRSISLATAYQCTDNTKPCIVTINIQSTASISLTGGTTNTGNALVGSTASVASGTGSVVCVHANSNTGSLTVGLNLSTIATTQCTIPVPVGGYFAVRQIAGTISVLSAFDQSAG